MIPALLISLSSLAYAAHVWAVSVAVKRGVAK